MYGGKGTGEQPVFEVHHSGDGEPALNSRGTIRDPVCGAFELPHPEIKDRPQVKIEDEEHSLEEMTKLLRVVMVATPDEFLLWGSGPGCRHQFGSSSHGCHG